MSDRYSLEVLLDKYLAGTLTEEERKVLQQLLNAPENQHHLAAIIDQELREHTYEIPEDKQLLSVIQQNLQQQTGAQPPKARLFNLRRLAVAAVLITLAGIGYYLWTIPGKSKPVIATTPITPAMQDIAPGGNKAILQLADGSQLILDSMHNGIIATQNGTAVTLQNAQVVYNAGTHASLNTDHSPAYNTITTPIGGQYQLTLADGSKVWLNSASSLRFPASFTGNERVVELTGEGYFEVAKNAAKPFKVHFRAGDRKGEVEVLGTHFNINAYDDEEAVKTTLLEGRVKVQSAYAKATADKSSILKPGEQAILAHDARLTIDHAADTLAVMAWKNGLFHFEGASLQSILRQAARWYNVQFQYKSEIKTGFSGEITRNVNISQLLKILELTGKVHFEIQGNTVIVQE